MASHSLTPVVVGVADVVNRSTKIEDAIEPMRLMLKAITSAIQDSGVPPTAARELQSRIDSIDIVGSWTWPYDDLPGLLCSKLGIQPRHKRMPATHAGTQPAVFFDEAARRISMGESRVAVITGGEALASLSACAAAKQMPPPGWTKTTKSVESVFSPTTRELKQNLGAKHSIGAPIHVYPLYENGFRAHRGQSRSDNNTESAKLYAEFAHVAESHASAWSYGKPAETEVSIGTVTKKNRMICLPYPLLMNAFNTVNLAAACVLTSIEYAKKLGIPQSRWIYPLGGAGTSESADFWERSNYHSSPAISRSLDAALAASNLNKEQIDLFDFYSCFPIVPKFACHYLGLPYTGGMKPTTLLGGLTSFGGAGNDYSMHALVEMVRQLREGKGQHGLVLGNGGVLTYQHVVCISSKPREDGAPYPSKDLLPKLLDELPVPVVDAQAEGACRIETYTVEFNRDGTPLRGHVVGRLDSNDHRFIANHADSKTLEQLSSLSKEPVGRRGWVRTESKSGRNLFMFDENAKI